MLISKLKKQAKLTEKEKAYHLACKHGLCPKIDGGYDTTNFDKFWEEFAPLNYDLLAEEQRSCITTQKVSLAVIVTYGCALIVQLAALVCR